MIGTIPASMLYTLIIHFGYLLCFDMACEANTSITEEVDLKKLPSAKGIWALCLTYCEEEDMFYVVYGVMNSMNARYFDVDNYLITAKEIEGPWSKPVYLHSSGFNASIFHDDNGNGDYPGSPSAQCRIDFVL